MRRNHDCGVVSPRFVLFFLLILTLVCLCGTTPTLAGWTSIGLDSGGSIWSLAIDPGNTQTIYAGTANCGVFKSTDGGTNWSLIDAGLTDRTRRSIVSLAIDPGNTQTIYAGTDTNVFMSTDGGKIWSTRMLSSSGLALANYRFLVIDPGNTQTIYAGAHKSAFTSGVFKSTNGGTTWSPILPLPPKSPVWSLAIDPGNTQTIYVGAFGGVLKSTNGGTTWSLPVQIRVMFSNAYRTYEAIALAIDPGNTQTIYAGTEGGVFKSTNGGNDWTSINSGLPDNVRRNIYSLAIDPGNTQTIYVGTQGGAFKSTDGSRLEVGR